MAISVILAAISEFACVAADGKFTVAGIIDSINVSLVEGATGAIPDRILMPKLYIAATFVGSIAEGLSHDLSLSLRHEDGQYLLPPQIVGKLEFAVNQHGRPPRANIIMELPRLQLPSVTADYDFEFTVNGERLAAVPLYITVERPAVE